MWGFRFLSRRPTGRSEHAAERAARWLREQLEREVRGRYAWLDAGVWADAVHAAPGVSRDTAQAAKRLMAASVMGDDLTLSA